MAKVPFTTSEGYTLPSTGSSLRDGSESQQVATNVKDLRTPKRLVYIGLMQGIPWSSLVLISGFSRFWVGEI